ncbi:MAG: hypothetical protein R3C26_14720 [Calditrichia bacterium]
MAGVTTAGLQWELRNETLAMGVREGCSNVFGKTMMCFH